LARDQHRFVEVINQFMEKPIPVDLGLEVHEHRAKPNRRAVHKDEFARRSDPAQTADVAMHTLGYTGTVGSAPLFLDQPFAIVQQRAIDE